MPRRRFKRYNQFPREITQNDGKEKGKLRFVFVAQCTHISIWHRCDAVVDSPQFDFGHFRKRRPRKKCTTSCYIIRMPLFAYPVPSCELARNEKGAYERVLGKDIWRNLCMQTKCDVFVWSFIHFRQRRRRWWWRRRWRRLKAAQTKKP